MNLRAYLILVCSVVMFSAVAAEKSPCPVVSDFQCLVRHSFDVYVTDYEHWWAIYHAGFEKAWDCRAAIDVATFLSLWSGETDGETAEGLTEDTSKLLVSKPGCFFEGVLRLRPEDREVLVKRFCPWAEPKTDFEAVLKEYAGKPQYKSIAVPLLKRVENDECT